MRKFKKIMALSVVAAMILSLMSLNVFAASDTVKYTLKVGGNASITLPNSTKTVTIDVYGIDSEGAGLSLKGPGGVGISLPEGVISSVEESNTLAGWSFKNTEISSHNRVTLGVMSGETTPAIPITSLQVTFNDQIQLNTPYTFGITDDTKTAALGYDKKDCTSTVVVTFIEETTIESTTPESISVPYGTTPEQLIGFLPKVVKGAGTTSSGGSASDIDVTVSEWNVANYVAKPEKLDDKTNPQTITGTLEETAGIKIGDNVTATAKITLQPLNAGTIEAISPVVLSATKEGLTEEEIKAAVVKELPSVYTIKNEDGTVTDTFEFAEGALAANVTVETGLDTTKATSEDAANKKNVTVTMPGTTSKNGLFVLTAAPTVVTEVSVKPAVIVSDESGVTASVTNKNITESSDIIITVEREDAEEAADISVVITPEGGTSVTVPQKDEDKANFVLAAGKTSGSFNLGTLAELFGAAPGEGTKLTFEIQYNGSTIVANEGDTATAIETVAPKSNGSNRPGGLPSSTGGGSTAVTYKITVEEAENGTVSVSPTTAAQGTTVTITTKGNEGYKTDKITVKTSRGTDVSVTDKKFTMPAYDVTVSVTFVEGEEEPDVVKGPFDDVAADFWAAEAITKLKEMGVINGETASTFNPNGNVTRAEFAKMVAELFDLKATTTTTAFVDCAPGDWFTSYVIAATEAGYVKGTSETTFSPNDQITRQDICTILGRALNAAPAADGAMVFSDADQIADYAYDYVLSFVGMSIVNGYEDGTFKPTANATRAEAAKIIYGVAQLADNAEADNSQIAPVTTGDDETAPVDENVADDNAADENAEDVSADDNAEDENAEDAPVDDNAEDEPAE